LTEHLLPMEAPGASSGLSFSGLRFASPENDVLSYRAVHRREASECRSGAAKTWPVRTPRGFLGDLASKSPCTYICDCGDRYASLRPKAWAEDCLSEGARAAGSNILATTPTQLCLTW